MTTVKFGFHLINYRKKCSALFRNHLTAQSASVYRFHCICRDKIGTSFSDDTFYPPRLAKYTDTTVRYAPPL